MKIRMLVSIAGSDFALSRNDETERFSPNECARLIAAGYAVSLEPAAPTEVSASEGSDAGATGDTPSDAADEAAADVAPAATTEVLTTEVADAAAEGDAPADAEGEAEPAPKSSKSRAKGADA
ncbi:hypothetical protein DFO45_2673 [Azorhizobium sp. AG788]|uniref:hypothetical protein n=1 Tax=Azorhizobium sp. AG788 TaxID=2183897 RepID=UPI00105C83B7|nr:hypothetical protein [Azorhizobium sp. AG788]TDT94915.1 hypothetical protein DFO45_2673 [Azorhizobium sp. AG788]